MPGQLAPEVEGRSVTVARARQVAGRLHAFCAQSDWAGYDPYDALNSEWLRVFPFLNSKWPRLLLTQGLKRSPFSFRRFLRVPKTRNSKALGLFVSALLRLGDTAKALELGEALLQMRSPGRDYWNWGYSFPWQTRTRLVPRNEPNLVCTVFVAEALLDLYQATGDQRWLEPALSAGRYLAEQLVWTDGRQHSFCYPLRGWKSRVHNANFLGAALLYRLASHTDAQGFGAIAEPILRYSLSRQQSDGSWFYGEDTTQGWIDSFHTGFNLCALRAIHEHMADAGLTSAIQRGFSYHLENHFDSDGAPKYFHHRKYPLDVHSAAQGIITLSTLQAWDSRAGASCQKLFMWTLDNLWDERGFFCYQQLPFMTVRIPYMRWGQAWMLLALSCLAAPVATAKDRS